MLDNRGIGVEDSSRAAIMWLDVRGEGKNSAGGNALGTPCLYNADRILGNDLRGDRG
jgi:hypothetical protein